MRHRTLSILTIAILACILFSCKTQYVPVPEIHYEYRHSTDTVRERDSIITNTNTVIRELDSAALVQYGLRLESNMRRAWLIETATLQRQISQLQQHTTDTVIQKDTVTVPYPVPAQLTRWQTFCCDYGKLMLGASVMLVILIVVFIIYKVKSL